MLQCINHLFISADRLGSGSAIALSESQLLIDFLTCKIHRCYNVRAENR